MRDLGKQKGSDVNLREATINDIEQLLALEQRLIDAERPFDASIKSGKVTYYDLTAMLSDADTHVLVVELAQDIIATGFVQIRQSKASFEHDQHAYLGLMFVSPEHRGQGINQRIMDALIAWSDNRGIDVFYLEVYPQNESAIKAYEKAGFKPSLLEMKR
ncbi:MAG: GNAT family N-acetyltransferase [Leucothrix sp.]